jgi:DNA primase
MVISNPFYHNDNKYFNINTENGACHDWRDDSWAGPVNPKTGKRPRNIVRFVQLFKGVSYRDALNEILGSSHQLHLVDIRDDSKEEVDIALVDIPPGFAKLDSPDNGLKRPVWDYLIKRGYEPEEIISEGIHYSDSNVLWLYTEFGQLVYLQSRNIYNKKFWFPPANNYGPDGRLVSKLEITKKDVIYGFDDVPRSEYVILTESIFDRIVFGRHAMSVGGAHITREQVDRLDLIGPKQGVIFAYDNDIAAIESILSGAPIIANKGYQVFFSMPPMERVNGQLIKDWNEMYTHAKLTKKDIVATMNKNLVRFSEVSKLRLKKILFELKNQHVRNQIARR